MTDAVGALDHVLDELGGAIPAGYRVPAPSRCRTPPELGLGGVGVATGTNILTPEGARLIETLDVGDLVMSADNGIVPIVRVRRRPHRSVRVVMAGRDGSDPLICGRRQLVLHRSALAQLYFGRGEVLMPAKDLVDGSDVRLLAQEDSEIVILQTTLPQIIFANGQRVATAAEDRSAPSVRMVLSSAEASVLDGSRWAQ